MRIPGSSDHSCGSTLVVHAAVGAAVLLLGILLIPTLDAGERHVELVPASAISNPDGAVVFATYCASCHGEDGRGTANARAALGRQVPDLTRIVDRHGEFDRGHVHADIAMAGTGHDAEGGMPCWSKVLRGMDRDPQTKQLVIRNLVRHIESLQQASSH